MFSSSETDRTSVLRKLSFLSFRLIDEEEKQENLESLDETSEKASFHLSMKQSILFFKFSDGNSSVSKEKNCFSNEFGRF